MLKILSKLKDEKEVLQFIFKYPQEKILHLKYFSPVSCLKGRQ